MVPPATRVGSLVERPDDELMLLAGAGVLEAFNVLVRRHERRVRSLCARICGSTGEGDEAAQECFVKLWKVRSHYEPRARFEAFFYTLVKNHCRNRVRTARPAERLELESAHAVQDSSGDPLQSIVDRQRRERLQRSLNQLPKAQKEAIVLRFSAELEYATISDMTGCSEATLRSRVFAGLNRLRQLHLKGKAR